MYKLFASSLIFVVANLGCGGGDSVVSPDSVPERYIPEVRLVDDGSNEFHFQWDEPLKEERIILVRRYGGKITFGEGGEDSDTVHVMERWFKDKLLYFPKDSFISDLDDYSGLAIGILSAKQRDAVELPARAWSGEHRWKNRSHERLILREHPFKPYRVGKSSRLNRSVNGYKFIGLFSD